MSAVRKMIKPDRVDQKDRIRCSGGFREQSLSEDTSKADMTKYG